MKSKFFGIIGFLLVSIGLFATHNRAGEISYVHAPLDGQEYRYEFTITTYANTIGSGIADRDSLDVEWGDGTFSTIARTNGMDPDGNGVNNGVVVGNGIRKNEYKSFHTFPGFAAFYVISMHDPNRNEGIININNGTSVEIEFYLEDTLFVLNPQFFGYNSSPVLSLPPIDYAQVGATYIHNPTAFDIDGDSLVFKLIIPKASVNADVPFYLYPDEVLPGPNNTISLDAQTGEFVWETPQMIGEYNIAFVITEYRNGIKIGTMIRDMQILVEDSGNTPPEIDPVQDYCLLVGDTLELDFIAVDNDVPEQVVNLSAYGAPLELSIGPATFEVEDSLSFSRGHFKWNALCDHIYSGKYTVVIRAVDNPNTLNPPIPLTDLETWQITVVAPAVTGLIVETIAGEIELTWDSTYLCSDNSKFIGYSVWRSIGCDEIVFDDCQMGLDGTSYTKIIGGLFNNEYTDLSAVKGIKYSYRIVAEFADANNNQGFPINVSESIPSDNVCAELPKDVPLFTNVSVLSTDENNGEIYVEWSKPNFEALDTTINVAPYTYELFRSDDAGGANFVSIASFVSNSFAAANDTIFTDVGLNTLESVYSYKLAFYASGDDLIGETGVASSVFINIGSSSNQLSLSWNENVPWVNQEYYVYRKNGNEFDSIGLSTNQMFTDVDLVNGREYCYFIKSNGSYFSSFTKNPLLNDSQIRCGVPIDTIPPCPPNLVVSNDCIEDSGSMGGFDFNYLSWESPFEICGDGDVVSYFIYYQDPFGNELQILDTLNVGENQYDHFLETTLAGCYYVTAVDSFMNESEFSNEFCVNSCLVYELPNAFTPGQDNQNDLYTPRPGARFVSRVEFEAFNRWGNLVFQTEEPALNWDGTDSKSGKELPEDVYYYVCKVYERNFSGEDVLLKELNGYIQIFRKID